MFCRLKGYILIFFLIMSTALAIEQSGCEIKVIESTSHSIIVDIDIDSIIIIQKQINAEWFTELSFGGCAFTNAVGLPRLPITSTIFGIPPEGTPKVSVAKVEQTSKSLGHIEPVVQLSQDDKEGTAERHDYHPTATPNGWYPEKLVSLGEVGYIRDQRIAQVEIHPVQYNTQTNMTRIVRHLRLQVSFENGGDVPIATTAASKPVKGSNLFETYFQKRLPNYDQAKSWRRAPAQSAVMAKSAVSNSEVSYKLTIESDGIYTVTGSDLIKAGANLSEIDFITLSLMNKGKLVPILVEGEGDGVFDDDDRIIFVGEFNRGDNSYLSPYTLKNVYWLSWGGAPGLRYAEVSGLPSASDTEIADAMRSRIHLEKDDDYQRFTNVPDETIDHWFWHPMGIGDENTFELEVTTPVEEGYAALRVGMRGLTYPIESPDHHVVAKINGIKVGEALWDNQEACVLENLQISPSLLNNESNVLTLELPGDLGVANDRVILNWIEFEYNRQFVVCKDTLRFQYPEYHHGITKMTKIWGFTEPVVYIFDSSGRRIIDLSVEKGEDSYGVTFNNLAVGNETYFVATESRIRPAQQIEKYVPADLKSANNGADYIVITHADFMEQATSLAQFRESQGLRTIVVDIQSVYDEFSFGNYDPRAIKRFLTYAYANWIQPAPIYILLFGDTTHNYDKLVWSESEKRRIKFPTYVPTRMAYTPHWGMCSTDNYFVCVNGDDFLPDMFIGRLPANTPEQANNMVDKIISYESNTLLGEWKNRICLATGGGDHHVYFEYSDQYLIDNFVPHRVNVSRLSAVPSSPYFGTTEELAAFINQGSVIMNFIGHGGGEVYFDSELFLIEDIERLTNTNKYPIFFSLTCFVGHFDNPDKQSLGEELLITANRGAVGHFGSSGKASIFGNYYLNNALFELMFIDNQKALGEVTTLAKLDMVTKGPAYWYQVKNYILLGDPATKIALADEVVDLQLAHYSLNPGDVLSVDGTVRNANNGTVVLSVFNDSDSLVATQEVAFSGGKFSTDLLVLDESYLSAWTENGGKGAVRAYYIDGQNDGVGGANFYVLKPTIQDIKVEPENPTHDQDIYISAYVETTQQSETEGKNKVRCLWSINKAQWDTLSMEKISGNIYRTNTPLQLDQLQHIFEVFYKIRVTDEDGKTIFAETPTFSTKILKSSNLFSRPEYVQIGGTEKVQVLVKIANIGETDAGPFKVRLYELDSEPESVEIGSPANISGLRAEQDTVVALVWPGNPVGQHRIKIRIDADNEVDETTELDNSINTEFVLITTKNGTQEGYSSSDGNAAIVVEPNGVDRNSSIEWQMVTNGMYDKAVTASNCEKVKLANNNSWAVYNLTVADSNVVFTKPFKVSLYYDQTDPDASQSAQQGSLKIFAWNPKISGMIGKPSRINVENGCVTAEVNGSASSFALLSSQDTDPPEITVCIEGQHFVDGDYVSQTPTISFVIEDSSGLDVSQQVLSIELDGTQLEQDEYVIFQDKNANKRVTCTYTPILEIGDHKLTLRAKDIHDNQASSSFNFSVSGGFSLISIANHPNPFSDETVIAFSLTEMAEFVDIDIFSSSGRRIWSAELADVIGYLELDWDGMDEEGEEVANGVYYMKFSAKKGDESIERIEKMARLK